MKNIIAISILLLSFSVANAQSVKLKKGSVLLDGKEIMKFERQLLGAHNISLYSLTDGSEQVLIVKNNNETPTYYDDDFIQIKFLQLGESVEMKSTKSFKGLIEWLIKQKIINLDGTINEENVPLFVKNYDENFTNRTVRY